MFSTNGETLYIEIEDLKQEIMNCAVELCFIFYLLALQPAII
jgi:hypothetical protein